MKQAKYTLRADQSETMVTVCLDEAQACIEKGLIPQALVYAARAWAYADTLADHDAQRNEASRLIGECYAKLHRKRQ